MAIGLQGAYIDQVYNYKTPTTGTTITLDDEDANVLIDPAAGLAALTVKMCAIPLDGQFGRVIFSQAITALTVSPNTGQSVVNAPGTIAAGKEFRFFYRAANTTWYITS